MYYLGQIIHCNITKQPILFGGIDKDNKVVCYDVELNRIEPGIDLKETAPLVNAQTGKLVLGNLFSDDFYGVISIKSEHQAMAKEQLQRFKEKVEAGTLRPLVPEDRK